MVSQSWKEMPVDTGTKLNRFGAIAKMMSFSPIPVSMVGPADHRHMHLEGYIEMVCTIKWLSLQALAAIKPSWTRTPLAGRTRALSSKRSRTRWFGSQGALTRGKAGIC